MLATDKSAKWNHGNPHDMEANVPLFERERRQDSQMVMRLQNELQDTKKALEAQTRRHNDLEYVNEDLERRLEIEARERINMEASRAEDERKWETERARLQEEARMWERKCDEEARRRAVIEERLRRSDKELYRMLQKKYDIEKTVRREESEKRKHEVLIVRSMETQRRASNTSMHASGSAYLTPSSHHPPSSSSNPSEAKPAAVRARQALASAFDFFGL
ncbi:hypothetical protein SDRG_13448 [Saprolegnia diclina VS20]|uniref:Meiosis-specific nuclear structural protein 1 n=1 Tax=Saprolegnia diclina (strain VS20) TaxID=1156394 RepID=T0Q5Q1_SAPDV|nr:hypothetical protein SDRG_13448 [Saprolegnia diclina VS20]EQC28765.1 hypothetical protein SDRG_13448 [Saprolegnia diclina VS20]|eukprot:XP_008617760.1 hypothetical protein SDRG_13448 [Saprolegnia diclina VS20]